MVNKCISERYQSSHLLSNKQVYLCITIPLKAFIVQLYHVKLSDVQHSPKLESTSFSFLFLHIVKKTYTSSEGGLFLETLLCCCQDTDDDWLW